MRGISAEHMIDVLRFFRRSPLLHLASRLPRIFYTDRGCNMLSLMAYKVYERLGVQKSTGSAFRQHTSGLCERAI
jgi:hypothetical protein